MLCRRESNCRLSKFAEVSKITLKLPTALFNRLNWLGLGSWRVEESRSSTSLANFIICIPKGYLNFFLNSKFFFWSQSLVWKLAPVSWMYAFFRDKAPNLSARSIFEKRVSKYCYIFKFWNIYHLFKNIFLLECQKSFWKTLFDSEF